MRISVKNQSYLCCKPRQRNGYSCGKMPYCSLGLASGFFRLLTISIKKKSLDVNLNSHNQTQTVMNGVGIEKERKNFFQKQEKMEKKC